MNFPYTQKLGVKIAGGMMLVLATTLSFAWTPTGSMHTARASHTATVLPNGHVLVAGGTGDSIGALASSELYNPASGSWSSTAEMNDARVSARAVLLPNGTVLTMGGCIVSDCLGQTTRSAEIYNPSTGRWTVTGSMRTAR
ncbi:MAG TPA: kelch repeat-containing protein, partial [Candidatus Sulfotelmatobacter sp.]|nr:kelch repeat-containing protein [Candidatus Sulfotelmatobacter sp.]